MYHKHGDKNNSDDEDAFATIQNNKKKHPAHEAQEGQT
jgi:hypothetical protein